MHGRSLHPRCGNREPSKMQVSSGKPMETKAGIQMFVKMQGHGRAGLRIFANIACLRSKPTEKGLNGAKTHGFNLTFRGLGARTPQNTGFENWPHPGCHTHFPDWIDMHFSVFLSSAGSPHHA